ncbi:hypothetical protein CMV_026183 [Castanea mollissima]|uniref:Uncharacterized protein n=1 Tax=Castanea mollissima TaxID=60419 RepID=A0A8J4QDH6_9ROSI|nr:hypothetical protein CMV_026183 [Castanea mollissima]
MAVAAATARAMAVAAARAREVARGGGDVRESSACEKTTRKLISQPDSSCTFQNASRIEWFIQKCCTCCSRIL